MSDSGAPQEADRVEAQEAAVAAAEISKGRLLRRFLSLRTLLSFTVAAGLLALTWILQGVKIEDVLIELGRANVWLIVLAYVVFGLTFPLRVLRWRLLLENAAHREHIRPAYRSWSLFQILYISWFVNGAVPLKLGDIYRAFLARANYATSLTRTLGTIASERVFDISTLILLVLISSAFVSRSGRVGEDVGRIIVIAAIVLGVIAAALGLMVTFGRPIVRRFGKRAAGVYDRFHSGIFDSFTWRTAPVLWLVSVAIWLLEMGRLTFVMRAIGVDFLGPAEIIFAGTAASLLLAAPTPGGLGAVEGGLSGLLRLVGIGPAAAVTITVVDRFISYWSVMASGFVVFLTTRLKR